MFECLKTKNAYYNGVRNGAVWWILVMGLAALLQIEGMIHQEIESTKGGKNRDIGICRWMNLVQTHKCSLLIMGPYIFQIKLC